MTNPILENIRHALGRPQETLLGLRPSILEPRTPASPDSEIALFLEEIENLSGVGQKLAANEVETALKNLVSEQKIGKASVWNTPLLHDLKIAEHLRALGVDVIPPNASKHQIAECDLGVTEADFILPETGTLALRSSEEKPRATSLAPRVHLAIVTPAALRADLHQVFAEAKNSHYLVFISGASRTADIELTLVLGVHGPKNLYVWVI